MKQPLGLCVPENQFLVAVINAVGVPWQPAAEGHLPSSTALAAWLWILQAAPQGHHPSSSAAGLWHVQGYLAEHSGTDLEHKVNGFALWMWPCHFPALSRGADPDSSISLRGGEHRAPSGTDSNVF